MTLNKLESSATIANFLILLSLAAPVFGGVPTVVKSPGKARLSGTVTDGKVAGQAVVTILAGSTILRQLTLYSAVEGSPRGAVSGK